MSMTTTHGTVTSEVEHRCPQKAKVELPLQEPFWKRCILPITHEGRTCMWVEEENDRGERLIVKWNKHGGTVVNYKRVE